MNKNLSKDEYEKILLHGAAHIMKAKNDTKVDSTTTLDIDKLIKEGEEKHRQLKEQASLNVESMTKDNTFDFNMESIDMFKF